LKSDPKKEKARRGRRSDEPDLKNGMGGGLPFSILALWEEVERQ
jgi:hypothetical protein